MRPCPRRVSRLDVDGTGEQLETETHLHSVIAATSASLQVTRWEPLNLDPERSS